MTTIENSETAYELTYRIGLTENVAIQPDVQSVVHPATDPAVPNAMAASVRLEVMFSGSK